MLSSGYLETACHEKVENSWNEGQVTGFWQGHIPRYGIWKERQDQHEEKTRPQAGNDTKDLLLM